MTNPVVTYRYFYRVTSGTMLALVWANGYRQAIKAARGYRNWRALGQLTAFQYRTRTGKWSPWYYVKTETRV